MTTQTSTHDHPHHLKVLFICTTNIQRSLTAENVCRTIYSSHEFKSAGVSKKECERNNSTLCTQELLQWADIIFVFEALHIQRIVEHTGQQFVDKTVNLNIEDRYQYGQTELVDLIKSKVAHYLSNTGSILRTMIGASEKGSAT